MADGALDLNGGLSALGFDSFRPGQQQAVETLLEARRLLLVAPTGGGKSLCYQLPASLLPGTSVVISPLIALMNDQVQALTARGISATFLASTLDGDEVQARMRGIAQGEYKLVYVAPERLVHGGFLRLLSQFECPLIAVDEAHCISEWGHDFRPEYMQVGEVIERLPNARVLACTATATPMVRDEILARLGLAPSTPQLVQGFARPNLVLRAREVSGKRGQSQQVDGQLAESLGSPGDGRGTAIVYSPTRKLSEQEATRLEQQGWRAAAYHAGLGSNVRNRVQKLFSNGDLDVVVATNAFGMGIDRSDVRAVVHLAPPGSIEAYYQEIGRAGRDGEPAHGLLLSSPSDYPRRRRLLELPQDGREPDPNVVEHKWGLFLELMRWTEGGSCRHDAILRYFDAEEEGMEGCGRCDVCERLGDNELDEEQTALIIRKALSGVARINRRFGLKMATKLLRGEADARLTQNGLDQVSTFGVLEAHSDAWLTRLINRCVNAGWVSFTGGDRPLLLLTREGHGVMTGRIPARLLLPPEDLPSAGPGPRKRGKGKGKAGPDLLEGDDKALFELLRATRLDLARENGVPPYVVASDRSLREMARLRPSSHHELLMVHGIGESKAERFGPALLETVVQGLSEGASE